MRWKQTGFLSVIFFVVFLGTAAFPVSAATTDLQQHITVIINQVRGGSCCDAGTAETFRSQAELLRKLNLKGNFALRYDAIQDPAFQRVVTDHPEMEVGGLLEVIPQLAADSGVPYAGKPESWHEAQHVFLVGYTQEQRQKLIDTFMTAFKKQFGKYPTFTNAWLIDTWSLKYLKEKYGVVAHELTREQFGTDSYTLYGGPPHYPYWPSVNWPLIPDSQMAGKMPLIVRQTIDDPVLSYGDQGSSSTSQPNDYMQRRATTKYFQHLFTQAHQQIGAPYTFALVGLENSMPAPAQEEFARQLAIVASWQNQNSAQQRVVSVSELTALALQHSAPFTVYAGTAAEQKSEQAFWIATPKYRARLRRSGNEVFISDLRVYDPAASDPYVSNPAKSYGWWIVPFVLDGSRFWVDGTRNVTTLTAPDSLIDRHPKTSQPTRIVLSTEATKVKIDQDAASLRVSQDDRLLAEFTPDHFTMFAGAELKTASPTLGNVFDRLQWKGGGQQGVWGFTAEQPDREQTLFTPFFTAAELVRQRLKLPQLLFPELKNTPLDAKKTTVLIDAAYVLVGRNPARVVIFPADDEGNPVTLASPPKVTAAAPLNEIVSYRPHGSNGMIFIDAKNDEPLQTTIHIQSDEYRKDVKITFAPNCRLAMKDCVTHPQWLWWYMRTVIGDKLRALRNVQAS